MLELMVGLKGSGKTKTLIEKANEAVETTNGSVAVIEYGKKLINAVSNRARLVETEEYLVNNTESLYGFTVGMYASNYDITHIFIDSALKICGEDVEGFVTLIKKLDAFATSQNINIFVTSSIEEDKLPEELKAYIK